VARRAINDAEAFTERLRDVSKKRLNGSLGLLWLTVNRRGRSEQGKGHVSYVLDVLMEGRLESFSHERQVLIVRGNNAGTEISNIFAGGHACAVCRISNKRRAVSTGIHLMDWPVFFLPRAIRQRTEQHGTGEALRMSYPNQLGDRSCFEFRRLATDKTEDE
jgi:hypothetical protein